MIRRSFIFLGIALVIIAVLLLSNGNFPTSGLMILTVGILITLIASVIRLKNGRSENIKSSHKS